LLFLLFHYVMMRKISSFWLGFIVIVLLAVVATVFFFRAGGRNGPPDRNPPVGAEDSGQRPSDVPAGEQGQGQQPGSVDRWQVPVNDQGAPTQQNGSELPPAGGGEPPSAQ